MVAAVVASAFDPPQREQFQRNRCRQCTAMKRHPWTPTPMPTPMPTLLASIHFLGLWVQPSSRVLPPPPLLLLLLLLLMLMLMLMLLMLLLQPEEGHCRCR